MKFDWTTATTVLIVLVVFKFIDVLFLDEMVHKVVGHFEE
jgi:hypothetical protein